MWCKTALGLCVRHVGNMHGLCVQTKVLSKAPHSAHTNTLSKLCLKSDILLVESPKDALLKAQCTLAEFLVSVFLLCLPATCGDSGHLCVEIVLTLVF